MRSETQTFQRRLPQTRRRPLKNAIHSFTPTMPAVEDLHITIIGAGTIGLSFAALHLSYASRHKDLSLYLTIHDTRPDIEEHIRTTLPSYIKCKLTGLAESELNGFSVVVNDTGSSLDVIIDNDLKSAVARADIVQEQGPENASFKTLLWPKVEDHCPPTALLWSSTSGIPASIQSADMKDSSRLIVVHPYNPPHIMPLLEIVPSPITNPEVISRTLEFWKVRNMMPIVLKKETVGFVANRLAFALLREAIHLVQEGVATVKEIDDLMTSSMGPRWAVVGIFKSYHAGGGAGGIEGFFQNIGETVQSCWDDAGRLNVGDGWEKGIFQRTKESYGIVNTEERDEKIRKILQVTHSEAR